MPFILKLGKLWLLIGFVVLGVYLSLQNQEPIRVSLSPVLPEMTVPTYAALLGAFFVGSTVAVIFFGWEWVRITWSKRQLKAEVRQLQIDARHRTAHEPERTEEPVSPSKNDSQQGLNPTDSAAAESVIRSANTPGNHAL